MFTIISHHYAVPEHRQAGLDTVLEVGQAMRRYPGFISRHTLVADDDPTQITSITSWRDKESAQAWDSGPDRQSLRQHGMPFWSKPPHRVSFAVVDELVAP